MDVERILLVKSERLLLNRIKQHGIAIDDSKYKDGINVLYSYHLIKPCCDTRYPPKYDIYGNDTQNAYCIVLNAEQQYQRFRRSKMWSEFRAWLTLILSAFAIIISIIALTVTVKVNIIESVSQSPMPESFPTESPHK